MSAHEIRACIDAFAADLSRLIQKAALDAVAIALQAAAPSARPRDVPVRPRQRVGVPGAKTNPRALHALAERIHAHVVAHPDQRIEQISVALGVPTKELALAVKALLTEKRIIRTGQARSTRYAAVAARAAAPPASTVLGATGERLVRVTRERKPVAVVLSTADAASK